MFLEQDNINNLLINLYNRRNYAIFPTEFDRNMQNFTM